MGNTLPAPASDGGSEPPPHRRWRAGEQVFELSRPLIMGVLNVTPDSFSDGGRFVAPADALGRAEQMFEEGADILDVGGESTRPGAVPIPWEEELQRVRPVVERMAARGFPVSVDTSRPEVMRAVIDMGAAIINDVRALRRPGALDVVSASRAGVCLMHMQGAPATMQAAPAYGDVVAEVSDFLRERAGRCEAAGIARDRIVLDPGFGFGKTPAHNLRLLRRLSDIAGMGWPVLAGLSRKSLLGHVVGRPVSDRLAASVTAALIAVERGAAVVRVHDVAATRDALLLWRVVNQEELGFHEH
jgi:dihydropteroate synthase